MSKGFGGSGILIPGSRCPRCSSANGVQRQLPVQRMPVGATRPERASRKETDAFNVAYVLYMQQTGREPKVSALE